jgi:methionyl-tRNA formyltransferase
VRVVFLGSPPFATPVLARLLDSPFRPLAVVTQPARARGRGQKVAESEVARLTRAAGVELIEPETVRAPEVHARLAALEPDVFLVVSYGEILRPEFVALARVVALNVHPSLLPRHRGATPIPAALLAGDERTGVAIQKVAPALDSGDLLLVRETPIDPAETAGELAARLATWSGELVLEALEQVESGRARYVPQDHARATVCKKLTKEQGRLDWTRPARELERLVRAMNPWPGTATRLPSGAELHVWRARATPDAGAPGTLLEAGPRLVVACGTGALELHEVQLAGKRALGAAEFLRGARLSAGERLSAPPA